MKKKLLFFTISIIFISSYCVAQKGIITTIAGGGTGGLNIPADSASLPVDVSSTVHDKYGCLYIACKGTGTIFKVDNAGVINKFAGIGTFGFSGDGGPATAARINMASGLVFDAAGDLGNYREVGSIKL